MTKPRKRTSEPGTAGDEWLEGADPLVFDKHGLATATGLTVKEIERHTVDGMPTEGERRRGAALRYRLPDVIQWLLRGDTLADAKTRERAAAAGLKELQLAERRGELIPVSDVARVVTDEVARVQSELMTIPARLVDPTVRDAVRLEIAA